MNILGLPALDFILETIRFPENQTASHHLWPSPDQQVANEDEVLIRSSQSEEQQDVQPRTKSKPAVIEISSHRSASGKTNLLYHLTAQAVLSDAFSSKRCAVVWLDTDGQFSVNRLLAIAQRQLSQSDPSISSTSLSQTCLEALKHVHVFRPQSSSQLLSTLENLSSYLLSETSSKHFSTHHSLSLLILDSASTFVWQDRGATDMARLETGTETPGGDSTTPSTKIITELKAIQARFDCTVIFTTTSPLSVRPKPNQTPTEPAAISPWTAFATLSLYMSRIAVPQFAPHLRIDECIRDAEARRMATAQSRFMVTVAEPPTGFGTGKEKEKLRALGKDRFIMKVGEDGGIDFE